MRTGKGPEQSSGESVEDGQAPSSLATCSVEHLCLCSSPAARKLLRYQQAVQLTALPLGVINVLGRNLLSVAVSSNGGNEVVAALQFATGHEVKLVRVSEAILGEAIFRSYRGDESKLAIETAELQQLDRLMVRPQVQPPKIEMRPTEAGPARFVTVLIEYGLAQQASDIHLLPGAEGAVARLRINGQLHEYNGLLCSRPTYGQLVNRLKVLAGLDIAEHRRPQEGGFTMPVGKQEARIRISILPTIHGERVVLRLHQGESRRSLDQLGLPSPIVLLLEDCIREPQGAVLFCGPTGSGKTTTMYSMLERLVSRGLSIVSIEDPVEVHLAGISQTSINEEIGLNYESCLKAVLRQDPDVLLVGEIRDARTAELALQAALTGHLLLATVHARSAAEALVRLASLGVERGLQAQALRAIVAQQLLPRLCPTCSEEDHLSSSEAGFTVRWAPGCDECHQTGSCGRALAVEALVVDQKMRQAIRLGSVTEDTLKHGRITTMPSALTKLLKDGVVSWPTALACGGLRIA